MFDLHVPAVLPLAVRLVSLAAVCPMWLENGDGPVWTASDPPPTEGEQSSKCSTKEFQITYSVLLSFSSLRTHL